MKFMVVDDSKISRMKLSQFIKELGYQVTCEACDGKEAIEKYKEFVPDFILSDLEMPNMKGDESAKNILAINPNANIILVTSIVDKKELINALRLGIKKVMQKPITKEQLAEAIDGIVGHKSFLKDGANEYR